MVEGEGNRLLLLSERGERLSTASAKGAIPERAPKKDAQKKTGRNLAATERGHELKKKENKGK